MRRGNQRKRWKGRESERKMVEGAEEEKFPKHNFYFSQTVDFR